MASRLARRPYERNARIGASGLAGRLALILVLRPRMFFQPDAAFLYTMESKGDEPGNELKPMWHNLGYWKTARTISEASADLARHVGAAAEIHSDAELLDVGCGCGEQDVLWAREFRPKRIVALDLTPRRVDLARARVAAAGLSDRVEVRRGSATELPFADGSFDRVVALECALHFRPRERFFAEAFRVLRAGGRLATADLLPLPGRRETRLKELTLKVSRRLFSIPEANVYDHRQYVAKLRERGFSDVKVESIRDWVFPGYTRQKALMFEGREWFSIVSDLQPGDFVADEWVSVWRDFMGLDDYVVVVADKPPWAAAGTDRGLAAPPQPTLIE